MSEETVKLHGRCLCGSVEISAGEVSKNVGACHCNMCRRWTGGPLLIVDCGGEITLKGADNVSFHRTSKLGERAFCSKCGSGLYYRYFDNNKHFVPAGLFDFDGFNFNHQIFIDEKPSYYSFSNVTKDMTGKIFCNIRHGKDVIETLDDYCP